MKKFLSFLMKFFVFFLVLSLLFSLPQLLMGHTSHMMSSHFILLPILFLVIIFILGGVSAMFFKSKSKKEEKIDLPPLTKEKEAHYLKAGLSTDDIDFFRETMNQARLYILLLEDNMNKSSKLRAINMRTHAVKAAKSCFKQIVDNPQKLHLANHFLYTHLPNLVTATDNFLTIDNYTLKNKEAYQSLDEATQIIEQLSQLIALDYNSLVAEDLEKMQEDLAVAKETLKNTKDESQ